VRFASLFNFYVRQYGRAGELFRAPSPWRGPRGPRVNFVPPRAYKKYRAGSPAVPVLISAEAAAAMAMTQGYIVGRPAAAIARPPTAPPHLAAAAPADRRPQPQPATLRAGRDSSLSMALPAFAARTTVFRWLRDYFLGLRLLVRSLPRFASLTVTYHSDLSFVDQVAPVLLLAKFFGVRTTVLYRSNKAETELDDYARAIIPFLRLSDRVVVSCAYLAEVFSRYGLTAAVRADTVDAELFPAKQVTAVQPHIIMTRRLAPGNGLTGALKAFHLVKQKYPRAELTIVGDGPLRPWLEEFVRRERIYGVTFTGRVDHAEVARRMAAADIYLNNATIDALPTSLLEALACGRCVVSTAVGEIPRVICDGRNGLLVAPNNFAGLADRLLELIETPALCARLSRHAPASLAQWAASANAPDPATPDPRTDP